MFVGVMRVTLELSDIESLKDKRSVVKSCIAKLQGKFNVGVAETDYNDMYSTAEIGIVTVANDRQFVNRMISRIEDYLEAIVEAEVIAFDFTIDQY